MKTCLPTKVVSNSQTGIMLHQVFLFPHSS
uniref:Uncharacterized protein n=1 Tax=Arundo donax TaxID=35708 RepID=A0A0A9BKU4_ARUDO